MGRETATTRGGGLDDVWVALRGIFTGRFFRRRRSTDRRALARAAQDAPEAQTLVAAPTSQERLTREPQDEQEAQEAQEAQDAQDRATVP
jgi:hypothetical protein